MWYHHQRNSYYFNAFLCIYHKINEERSRTFKKTKQRKRFFFSFIFFLCSPRAMLSLDVVLKLYFAKLYKYGISITSKFFLKNCSIVESDKPFSKFSTCECKIHFLKRHLMLTFAKFKSFGHLFMHILRFKVGRNPKKCVCHLQGNCSGCLKC